MKDPNARIELHSGPDDLGRCHYTLFWYNADRPYCAVCGKETCEHADTLAYGQCAQEFFGVPKASLARREP